jgi:cell division protease FtsH
MASIGEELATHFAPVTLSELVVVRRDFPHWMRPDLQKAIEPVFAGAHDMRFFGVRLRTRNGEFSFTDIAAAPGAVGSGPAVYQDADIGEEMPMHCLVRGLWTTEKEGVRFSLLLDVSDGYRGVRARVEIAVPPGEEAKAFAMRLMGHLQSKAERADSWRGKLLVLDSAHDDFELAPAGLRVERFSPVRREEIILPLETLNLVERNTVGFAQNAERLTKLGLSAKKGVLLYGPPGTGKTLLVRWLAGALEGYTKLIVTAGQYGLLSEYLAIARALQPVMIVLEDVDLVGGHRDGPWAAGGAMLNTLLNGMDGFARDAQILFVLTTNRPEVLEPALSARPGRIDQAIEIGLPREAERRLLAIRYAGALGASEEVVAGTAKCTGGASPAFIRELMRRAAQRMVERGSDGGIEMHDVDSALQEMLGRGGKLVARILGADSSMGFTAEV